MWCPDCRTEYIEGITVCGDCGAALVDELPPPPKKSDKIKALYKRIDIDTPEVDRARGNVFVFWAVLSVAALPVSNLIEFLLDELWWRFASGPYYTFGRLTSFLRDVLDPAAVSIVFFFGLLYYLYHKKPVRYITSRNIIINLLASLCVYLLTYVPYWLLVTALPIYSSGPYYIYETFKYALIIAQLVAVYSLTVAGVDLKRLFLSKKSVWFYTACIACWLINTFGASYYIDNFLAASSAVTIVPRAIKTYGPYIVRCLTMLWLILYCLDVKKDGTETRGDPSCSGCQSEPESQDFADEDERRTFVGENTDYYISKWEAHPDSFYKGWNWVPFFFCVEWLAYRKMYVEALLAFLSSIGVGMLFGMLFPASSLRWGDVIRILVAVFGNGLYYRKYLRASQKSSGMERADKRHYLAENGGRSIGGLIAAILLESMISLMALLPLTL